MKPYKTLLILLVFMVLLYGPSLFNKERIHIGESFSIGFPEVPEYLNIKAGVHSVSQSAEVYDTISIIPEDTLSPLNRDSIVGIESPGSTDSYLSLLDSLSSIGQQTRILYYGDSQLEGDRITDYIRKELRVGFYGTGPGLLSPTMLVPYTRTVYIRSSPNWERYNYRSFQEGIIEDKDLGPLLSFSRFRVKENDTTDAWIRISPSSSADKLSKVYNTLRIFYGQLPDSVQLEIKEDKNVVHRCWIGPTKEIAEYKYHLNSPKTVELKFRGTSSPDIYGVSLESDTGLIVDNIPLRGSAGLEFTRTGANNLREAYKLIDPDLIILHFGLNIVLNIKDDYTYYGDKIFRQIEHLKQIYPQAKVLLIGVTDMAREDESGYHSYPNIPDIINAQREAAERAGVLFWDSWKAMGGVDAIVKWRDSEPPLAYNDYTHISYYGGHRLGELLLEALTLKEESPDSLNGTVIIEASVDTLSDNPSTDIMMSILSYDVKRPLIFTSAGFWIFLFLALCIYSLVFSKPLLRNSYLFFISLFFYYKSGGIFFGLLILSTISDYLAGWMIYSSRREFARKLWVLFSLVVNIGMLAYFKYTAFITFAINDLFGLSIPVKDWLAMFSNSNLGTGFDVNSIILPVGISFFTFQTISYTIDVYRKKTKPVKNILDLGFYVSFFPQLVSGPIVRASEFIPQLYQKFNLSKREWSHALFLIVSGLIKKIVISDYIAVNFVDRIFASPGLFSGLENLLGVYAYGLQIYCDFSGYTDIAIGIALMLGFRLPVNFNSPYKASSITDFWRRWHISLSRWLKDYLYIPLGGSRKGSYRTNINLFITMLLGGLWHGAAWRFMIWGGLHGGGLAIHKIWIRIIGKGRLESKTGRLISILITFNFVSFCWIFFRADDIESVKLILDRIFTAFNPGDLIGMLKSYASVLLVLSTGYIIHFLPVRTKEAYRGMFISLPLPVQLLLVYIIAIALFNIQQVDFQPFIYFRF
jgi:alginate O-acetyltransferase complex protein AlgI